MTQNNQKCSVIALIGSPNAGKSTLLNQLIGSKISIVSPKVQTTRDVINGICIHNNAQLIFCDTPGIFSDPKRKIEKSMVKVAWDVLREVDHIALIIDSRKGICSNSKMILDYLSVRNIKPIIILNKIDLLKKNRLLELTQQLNQLGVSENIFMLSALNGDGVNDFKEYLTAHAKEHPWLYPEDDLTTAPKRFIAAEIVREKLFLQLEEELPYNILVDVEKWEEFDNGQVKINMLIYCTKDSHKSIILGKSGKMIKMIGLQAREELEQLLGQKIHLFLFVKVKDDCIDNFDKYR